MGEGTRERSVVSCSRESGRRARSRSAAKSGGRRNGPCGRARGLGDRGGDAAGLPRRYLRASGATGCRPRFGRAHQFNGHHAGRDRRVDDQAVVVEPRRLPRGRDHLRLPVSARGSRPPLLAAAGGARSDQSAGGGARPGGHRRFEADACHPLRTARISGGRGGNNPRQPAARHPAPVRQRACHHARQLCRCLSRTVVHPARPAWQGSGFPAPAPGDQAQRGGANHRTAHRRDAARHRPQRSRARHQRSRRHRRQNARQDASGCRDPRQPGCARGHRTERIRGRE